MDRVRPLPFSWAGVEGERQIDNTTKGTSVLARVIGSFVRRVPLQNDAVREAFAVGFLETGASL